VTDLSIWVVYDHPSDFPDHYVARLWEGETPTSVVLIHRDLERLRERLERLGLVHLDRMEGDDPVVLETWL
jgi:hypothetical protein